MKRLAWGLAVLMGLGLATNANAQDRAMSIVTGGTGGVYYPLGGGLANMLTKYVKGWSATAEVTGGSVDNLKLVGAERADIAFAMADATLDSLRAEGKFKGQKLGLKTLAVLYPNRMHVVTTESTGIKSVADLKGKRVSTGSQGSATEVMAFRVLQAAGLDPEKDITRERLGVAESTNAVKDGKIDAYFWVGGVPTSAVTDLGATPGLNLHLIDHSDLVEKMNAKWGPLYSQGIIKAESYPGQEADNKQANVWNILVVHESMPDDVAYNIVKTIFEKKDEWVATHKAAAEVIMENQVAGNSPAAFHPGAVKFFTEKGHKVN
ncbi:TAXI family TRAP transporter solute-binding subunit [Oceanibaculum pacificum]|uniref:C4-dicarboxylate ABC transporter substrate-binding protein n=1 Tax=Oceanibaculum pacificum TaxID=580166 RepID=A0A154W403_9PROT|nr:TAXI family TRAP transporter solute-binding subunit [Oceanibaculum pacificum]KZD08187.1 C4-dicarboxylate ABC transporter substrate-binding protein [Oceanibaculum pacificum]